MTILYINGGETAESIGKLKKEVVAEFPPAKCPRDITNITLLAHTSDNATKIGGRTPKELAQNFATMIPGRYRTNLKHIYLIAAEAGMCKHGEPSLAQAFVNAMNELGFTHLDVHAVASPGVPRFGMGVEVVTDTKMRVNRTHSIGAINAFYYENSTSYDIDKAISESFEAIERLQKERKKLEEKADSIRECKQVTRTLSTLTAAHNTLIHTRKASPDYKRVYILSTEDYKTAMNDNRHTFQANESEPVTSPPASYAIYHLSTYQAKNPGKYTDWLSEDLGLFSDNPQWGLDEILQQLNTHSNKKGNENVYYNSTALPLRRALEQLNSGLLEEAMPYDARRRTPSPIRDLSFFAGSAAAEEEDTEPTARQRLEQYQNLRKGEWGDFHYNLLGIMSVLYLISDYLSGTNYYNSKHRAVKLSAVNKLLTSEPKPTIDSFTPDELGALHEGRLGELVKSIGGDLDGLLDELYPPQTTVPDDKLHGEDDDSSAAAAMDDFDSLVGMEEEYCPDGMSLH